MRITFNTEKYFVFEWRCSCGWVHIEKMFEREFVRKKHSFKLTRPCEKCGKPNTALKKTKSVYIK